MRRFISVFFLIALTVVGVIVVVAAITGGGDQSPAVAASPTVVVVGRPSPSSDPARAAQTGAARTGAARTHHASARVASAQVPVGHSHRSAGAANPSQPVPSLSSRPARGPSYGIVRFDSGWHAALQTSPGGPLVGVLGPKTEFGSPVALDIVRRQGDWLGVLSPMLPNGQVGWVRYDPTGMQLYWTKYSVEVDLSQRALELRYGKKSVADVLVSIGGVGTETPPGRFAITDALLYGSSPYYGCCALALTGHQPHLPAGWLGGDRIAIHGTLDPVGYAISHGCIRATDATMRFLFSRVPLGTPVFVHA